MAGYPTVYIHTPFSLSGHALVPPMLIYNFAVVSSDVINIWGVICVLSPPPHRTPILEELPLSYKATLITLGSLLLEGGNSVIWSISFDLFGTPAPSCHPLCFSAAMKCRAFLPYPLVMIHCVVSVPKQKIHEIIVKPLKLWATFKLSLFKVHYLNTFISIMELWLTELLSQSMNKSNSE